MKILHLTRLLSPLVLLIIFVLSGFDSFSQKKPAFVSGKVVDENENPLSNVSIVILGRANRHYYQ
ncbi:MAG: hypothetical protein WDN26_01835 [Chitinophagaceae bacterium]